MTVADCLTELGIARPPVFLPAGVYEALVIVDGLAHVSGHGPIAGAEVERGKVGGDLSLADS